MDAFVGRRRELDALEAAYRARGSTFLPIYGRRRVGKSELIAHFLRHKPAVYLLGKRAQGGLQLREFLREAARVTGDPLLATFPAEGWKPALDAVVDRWRGADRRRLVLAFDEFQWTAEASPELPSVLQDCWDRRWQREGSVMLILCGSYIGFMEREVLGRGSPLFGRRTGQILLRPFGYREATAFHPGWSAAEHARVYFLCGGIPLYLKAFAPHRSFEQSLAATLLAEDGLLYREPDFLLREELREVESYYAVLLAIAEGARTSRDIARASGIGERGLQYYLKQLMELGYVARRYPLTGAPPVARHVRYDLHDPLLRFWFRFVYPNTSFIARAGARRALMELVRPRLEVWAGGCFERLCREALADLYVGEGVSDAFEIGEYWDKATQIDVVGFRRDGWTDLGECKWGPVRSVRVVEAELEQKVAAYPNRRNATIGRRIFARRTPPAAGDRGRWHDLEDLYTRG
jgi:AAA+ ATPase superfamily predicted ATPase